jgi:hypothetical protein
MARGEAPVSGSMILPQNVFTFDGFGLLCVSCISVNSSF